MHVPDYKNDNHFLSTDRSCAGASSYNNLDTGTCVDCPSVCVDGCSGPINIAGSNGCDMCYITLLSRNGSQVSILLVYIISILL